MLPEVHEKDACGFKQLHVTRSLVCGCGGGLSAPLWCNSRDKIPPPPQFSGKLFAFFHIPMR